MSAPASGSGRRISAPRAVLAVAVLGVFMAFIDATIVNIAVPSIYKEFSGSGLASVSWVLNAYNIVFAAFLVGGGQLADLLGRRRVFSMALLVFTFASALCALAPTLEVLVAARVIQAAGAAALVPSSLAIVLEAHEVGDRMHAVALWAAIAALAAGIGPPLGGLLITASSWRLVFLVNIPVGIVALVLARQVLVESRAPGRVDDRLACAGRSQPRRADRIRRLTRVSRSARRAAAWPGTPCTAPPGKVAALPR